MALRVRKRYLFQNSLCRSGLERQRFITLTALLLLAPGVHSAEANRDKSHENNAELTRQQIHAPARGRPLVVGGIKTGGISLTERIAMKPKYNVVKPARTEYYEGLRRNVVIVKFVDGARVRDGNSTSDQRARTDGRAVVAQLDGLRSERAMLNRYDEALLARKNLSADGVERDMRRFRAIMKRRKLKHWGKLFSIDDDLLADLRLNAEITKKQQSADLSNYFVFHLDDGEHGERLADRLNALDIVEIAYLAPIPVGADIPPKTPSFKKRQEYLDPAPKGIDADYAWTVNGGKGREVKIIDIEHGWDLDHEDLPEMFTVDGRLLDRPRYRDHGTGVLGIMVALDNGAGVSGIVPEARAGVVSVVRGLFAAIEVNRTPDAILTAALKLSKGDVLLIERQVRGPHSKDECPACGPDFEQCGLVPVEYNEAAFDAVEYATGLGVIVVAVAGNGGMRLDHPRYKNKFNREERNSGAIIVGAGDSSEDHFPLCFSNYGSRIDLQGWGENVMTTGYGAAFGVVGDIHQSYTATFSGTSSAAPIVAGAVAAVQGVRIANDEEVLKPGEMADLLRRTGTPYQGAKAFGPLPNLRAAIEELEAQPPPPGEGDQLVLGDTLLDADREVSGFRGARTRVLGEPALTGAIERLSFGERGDRPCYVRVEKADISKNTIITPHAELDLCGNRGPADGSLDYVPLLTSLQNEFIRGVAVCNSKTNNGRRLKGVRVHVTGIGENGELEPILNPKQFERPNCDGNWSTPAMCPKGAIAAKLIVHIDPDGNDEVLTGLSLRCKAVNVKQGGVAVATNPRPRPPM